MAEPTAAQRLAERLVELRTHVGLTQGQVAAALGVSVPLLSSWENARATPPEARVKAYALLLALDDPGHARGLPDESDLSDVEEARRRRLIDELIDLRDYAVGPANPATRQTGALGGRFWYFPDGAPIRIITTKMWPSVLDKIPYADPRHPNYIRSYADADCDATIELFGHLRAENPTADVRFLTADQATHEDISGGHVVILGQGDSLGWLDARPSLESPTTVVGYLNDRLELPVAMRIPPGGDPDFDSEFVVTLDDRGAPRWYPPGGHPAAVEPHRPRFLRDGSEGRRGRLVEDDLPVLEYDVALLARRPNQLNLATTVTICAGVFSRGTYGAVRTLTDAGFRTRNEAFLSDHFPSLDDFWMIFYVPVFRGVNGLDTVTPDLERGFHRLRSSRPADLPG